MLFILFNDFIFLIVSVIIASDFWIDLLLSICVKHAVWHSCFVWTWIVHCTDIVAAIITVHPFFYFQIRNFNWKSSSVFLLKIIGIRWRMSYSFFLFISNWNNFASLIFWFEVVRDCLKFIFVLLILLFQIWLVCKLKRFARLLFLIDWILFILIV